MNNTNEKVIKFKDKKVYKEFENEIRENEVEEFDEAYRKAREFFTNNYKDSIDKKMEKRIIELEEENKLMKRKVKNSFPLHILLYLTRNVDFSKFIFRICSLFDVEVCSNFFLRFIIIFSQISYVFEFHNPILVP